MEKKSVKRRLNKKALLVILLTLYLIIMAFYYCFTLPIKNIVIEGNSLVSDASIIDAAGIKNYPEIFKTSSSKIVSNVSALDFIEDVSVKKSLDGTIRITVTESKVLFYNILNSSVVLSNNEEVVMDKPDILGLPTLVNYVPSDIYEELIKKMSETGADIISLISEIEYSPDVKDDVTINDSRFILRMNDGNHVYIDLVNFENLEKYKLIYSSLEEKGVLHLDGVYAGSDTIVFTSFAALAAQNETVEGEENELPQ